MATYSNHVIALGHSIHLAFTHPSMGDTTFSFLGIPNDYGVMSIEFFRLEEEEVFVIDDYDLPYVLRKHKKMKAKNDLDFINFDIDKDQEEEEESEEETSSEEDDDDEEEESESEDEEKTKKKTRIVKKKKSKEIGHDERKTKMEEIQAQKDRTATGVLSIFKLKMQESLKANKVSEDLELSLEELDKNRPVRTFREEAKQKADDEIRQVADNQANLFKLSLNKDKWYYKEMTEVDVIAEAHSVEEVSTVKNSLTSRVDNDINIPEDPKGILKGSNNKEKPIKVQNINFSDEGANQKKPKKIQFSNRGEDKAQPKEETKIDEMDDESYEGEESEKEENGESEPSDIEINYDPPKIPAKKKQKYFERFARKKNYENKVLLVNYQHEEDHEFFLKKLYYLYTLKPRMVIISYVDSLEYLKPYYLNKLAESNDVRVVLVKQSLKQDLIEAMTTMVGKKKLRRKILDGILLTTAIVPDSLLYSWGCASHGKLGIGDPLILESNSDFQVSCPQNMTVGFQRVIDNSQHKKSGKRDPNYLNYLYTYVPQIVMSNYGIHFKSLACGRNHSMALSAKGRVYLWGDNSYSQLSIYQNSTPHKNRENTTPPSLRIGQKNRNPNISPEGLSSRNKLDSQDTSHGSFSKESKKYQSNYISTPMLHPKFGQYSFIQSKEIFCSEYTSGLL